VKCVVKWWERRWNHRKGVPVGQVEGQANEEAGASGGQATPASLLRGIPVQEAIADFRLACVSRAVDDREIALRAQSKVFFQISGAGHEALLLGLARDLRPAYDWFFPYYRDGALMLGLGITAYDLLLQAVGSAEDPSSGGRQMPTHWGFKDFHVVTQTSATGSQCLPAVGCAEASRYIARRRIRGLFAHGDELVYVSLGEGATSQGEFWESLNTACRLHLPVLYVVADNGYAISVRTDDQAPAPVSELVQGFRGLHVVRFDGRDYFEVREKGREAIAHVRAGAGPCLLHATVTRPYSHSLSDDQTKYRSEEDLQAERDFDPIDTLEWALLENGILSYEEAQEIRVAAREEVQQAAAEALATSKPDPGTVTRHVVQIPDIPEPHTPDPAGLFSTVATTPRVASPASSTVAPASSALSVAVGDEPGTELRGEAIEVIKAIGAVEPAEVAEATDARSGLEDKRGHDIPPATGKSAVSDEKVEVVDAASSSSDLVSLDEELPLPAPAVQLGNTVTMADVIRRVLHEQMAKDERVRVFGEDVADASESWLDQVAGKGGVFGVTQGLQRSFGIGRCFNTPLAEANIVGRGIGQALRGLKPCAEIQFFDYIWTAFQQIKTEAATTRWRSNGRFSCPLVIRVAIGGYLQGGSIWHSQCGETFFSHIPGLIVLFPSRARDAAGLLRAAFLCDDPVLFLEHKHLYRQVYAKDPFPPQEYVLPIGKGTVLLSGRDITLVTYGATVRKCQEAARIVGQDGISVELIDLRTVSPWDQELVADSVQRTGKLVVVHEDTLTCGFGAEVAAWVAEHCFWDLDAPVLRVGAADTHVPYEPGLEKAVLPQTATVVAALQRAANA